MQRIESACARYQTDGEATTCIEEHLSGWSGEERDLLLRRLLEIDVRRMTERGETLPIQKYRDRFPEQVHVVERVLGGSSELGRVVERLGTLGLIPLEELQRLQSELLSGESDLTIDSLCRQLAVKQYLSEYQSRLIARGEVERLQLGDYLLVEKLGQGGMGVVYLARQRSLNRFVALKTMRSREAAEGEEVRRFRQEAESAARLKHPGIVAVFDVGEANGVHYIAMEYVEGTSLAAKIQEAPLAPDAAAGLVRRLAEAVAYAHAQGVIHRDLKPANILLEGDRTPRIADFGLAKLTDREGETVTGEVLGTPSFMSPEQAAGKTGAIREATDIYSLGAILYAALCGHAPFRAETVLATLKLVMEQSPVSPREFNRRLPVDLETICLKSLEKNPAQRFSSATELAEELGRFLEGRPIQSRPVSRLERFRRWCLRNPWIAGLSSAAVMILIAGTAVSTYFAILAERRTARAVEGTRIAVETLESVIFQMQEKLQSIPAAREARREILQQAMKEVEKLSDLQVDSRRIDLSTAVVLSRFAAIIFDVGTDESLGSLQAADKYLRRSIEILKPLQAADPGNEQLRIELSFALLSAGDLAVSLGDVDRAEGLVREGLVLYRQLAAEQPDKTNWTRRISHGMAVLGDIALLRGDAKGALAAFEEARVHSQKLLKADPKNPAFKESEILAVEKLADTQLRLGNIDVARQLYEENLKYNVEHVAEDPQDSIRLDSLSFCYERLAEFEVKQGRPEQAIPHYQKEVEVLARAIELDPKNRKLQEDIQKPLRKLDGLCQRLNRGEESAASRKLVDEVLNQGRGR